MTESIRKESIMVQKKRGDLLESVKKAVAEIGKAADGVEKGMTSIGPDVPPVQPEAGGSDPSQVLEVPVKLIKEISDEVRKLDTPSALPEEVYVKVGWQERARRLRLVPKIPQKLSGDQQWKVAMKGAGKVALKSVGASLGYMVIMSAMATGFALAVRSNDSRVFVDTIGSHDS
jgi:hypothetical protein